MENTSFIKNRNLPESENLEKSVYPNFEKSQTGRKSFETENSKTKIVILNFYKIR